jgi:hypothetical protein
MVLARNLGIDFLISLGNVADLDIQFAVEKAILNFQKVEQAKSNISIGSNDLQLNGNQSTFVE